MAVVFMIKSYCMDLVLDTGFSRDGFEVIQQARSGVEREKADEVAHAIADRHGSCVSVAGKGYR